MSRRAAKRRGAFSAILTAWVGLMAIGADGPADLPRGELARRGRAATAFLVGQRASATAFCIHPSGLFVTNDHAVQDSSADIKIVLNSGMPEQRVLAAKVVHHDKEADLALLRVENAAGLPTLSLGLADELDELMEVFAFGFPFGKLQATGADQYPSISVNRGEISSLKRKDGQLERIQLNVAVNPGNSGGPVLNAKGMVVGVIVGRVQGRVGAGIDLAIPVNMLDRFLNQPAIEFTLPSSAPVKKGEAVEFKASVVSRVPSTVPLTLQLVFAAGTPEERRVAMVLANGIYQARAVPFPAPTGPESVAIKVKYADGAVTGLAQDQSIVVGGEAVRLSKLRSLRLAPDPEARMADGKMLDGTPVAPKFIMMKVGGQTIRVDLSKAIEIGLIDADTAGAVICTLVARRGSVEAGRVSLPIYLEGAAQPSFDALRNGRFIKPPRSHAPVSYLRIEGTPGHPIGKGNNYAVKKEELNVSYSAFRGIECRFSSRSGSGSLALRAGQGRFLEVGEYRDAKPFSQENRDSPGFLLNVVAQSIKTSSGEFRVWEYEANVNGVARLAVDFVLRGDDTPPLVGMLRYNSTFY